ncbi:MAG: hypothetical protein HN657_06345 [Candidatus Marinimicrobia bacterium]|jgi:hypothetical protein|nr:hypothetical protein [Candidatus Neomarinimicrobiota bacterium]MBT3496301.1 hypothetical protein [Candidatus Neomarinimicrobiota bacterium]MBT3691975.1 hypothetical protein [Candidatus Neomarinimicrobiota bacterium]MBT3732224.1 hypothetical protein [Candidatus Neomarinimicrobiota bacterium]MBT4144529.1 hypothetical protein [Candidatus Neomarinimicrobiota bacterium]
MKFWILLISSFLCAGETWITPIDLGGHYGLASEDGRAIWNQDWESGPFLFDGTFAHYPARYGPWIQKGRQATFSDTLADTVLVDSWFNYEQGDYNYDALDLGLNTLGEKRKISLNAYKRSFPGHINQYAIEGGSSRPTQQSYGIQYQSKDERQSLWAGFGQFVTHNGIPDSASLGELTSAMILSALHWKKSGEKTSVSLSFNQFQNQRKLKHSQFGFSGNHFLNRNRISLELSRNYKWDIQYFFGMKHHARSFMDSTTKIQEWQEIYDEIKVKGLSLKSGFVQSPFSDREAIYDLKYEHQFSQFHLIGEISKTMVPRQITLWSGKNNFMETWKKKRIQLSYLSKQISLFSEFGNQASNRWLSNETSFENQFNTFNYYTISSNIKLWRTFAFDGSITAVDSVTFLNDGAGQKIKASISGQNWIFSETMDFRFSLSVNGWLNRSDAFQFDYLSGEMRQNLSPENLNDIWLLNFEIEAIVSTFTIRYTMKNLLAFFDAENQSYRYTFHDGFPAFGRQMTIGVEWHFDN